MGSYACGFIYSLTKRGENLWEIMKPLKFSKVFLKYYLKISRNCSGRSCSLIFYVPSILKGRIKLLRLVASVLLIITYSSICETALTFSEPLHKLLKNLILNVNSTVTHTQ